MSRTFLTVIAALLISGHVWATGYDLRVASRSPLEPGPDQIRFFESKVRPLLVNRCQKCHGKEKQQGGLRLDSREAILTGGGRGPAIEPGHPEESILIAALKRAGSAPVMPPGQPLPDRDIADLARWIKDGAAWPSTTPNAQLTNAHWAFQPVRRPAPPAVKNMAWVKSPIDAFILAELEKKGLTPAPPADRRTLIRRATFDLTGLPPTPEEVEAFIADRSPNAFAKVVERLLASPAYGERWGRHWLDVARYSDTNGMDENVHYGNAWRYRDYVVAAINNDKPFDQFVIEQLAGDLLHASATPPLTTHDSPLTGKNDLLIAAGFLSIGPKLISEVDDQKTTMDMVDEQVDTVGRTFMGLTLGCARCHDHKFDPIRTQEYYALAGVFKSTKTMEITKKPRMWYEHSLAGPEDLERKTAHEQRVAEQKKAIADRVAQVTEALKGTLKPGETLPKNPEPHFPEATRTELKALREALAKLEKDAPEMPAAMAVTEGPVADIPIHIRGDFLNLGAVAPRGVPAAITGPPSPTFSPKESGRQELARWLVDPAHPLTGRVLVNRVWRWHFGRGIVPSVDNFGLLGDRPSHPALLDWLAAYFVNGRVGEWENGRSFRIAHSPTRPLVHSFEPSTLNSQPSTPGAWSLKSLHRLLMLSNTYQMSAKYDPKAASMDPEDRLLWRWPVRRLEAEEIRDAVLAVSGQLDRTMGGSILPLKNREYVFDHTSKDMTRYESKRRSIYLPVIRNHVYDVFQIFDFGDGAIPEGNRPTTTVAPQALFMMNSSLVMDAADALAKDVLAKPGLDDAGRIRVLYTRLYGRPAAVAEVSRGRELLVRLRAAGAESEIQAWGQLSHTLLQANEFIFLN